MMADKTSVKPKGQKAIPFWELLKSLFPDVQCERKFPWLVVPRGDEASEIEVGIRAALIEHCRAVATNQHPKKQECTPELLTDVLTMPKQPKLEFDFFVPSLCIAFEFDERQHFTAERAVTLALYPGRVHTFFDVAEWVGKCHAVKAVDPDPVHRDWQRAYRDAVRDVRAAENGIKLMRYAYDKVPQEEALRVLASAV